MTQVIFANKPYSLNENETVLECLLRHGVSYPCSCKAGACQTCLSKATNGAIDPEWQIGLKDTLKQENYFLACVAKPSGDVSFQLPELSDVTVKATITDIKPLTHNVIRLHLAIDSLSEWIPGKYLHLTNPHNVTRSYSIANLPEHDGYIEIHLKLRPSGAMSDWLMREAKVNMSVAIGGPVGDCYYCNPKKLSFDIVLAGTGTGLAPLMGIAKDALSSGHKGNICLIHGGCTDDDLYCNETLKQLASQHDNFSYKFCVLKSNGLYPEGRIDETLSKQLITPSMTKVYLCGPEDTVSLLKKKAFLSGVSSSAIFSDAFLQSK